MLHAGKLEKFRAGADYLNTNISIFDLYQLNLLLIRNPPVWFNPFIRQHLDLASSSALQQKLYRAAGSDAVADMQQLLKG